MACAPKSNSAVNAIFDAMQYVKEVKTTVPVHLQDAHYKGAQKLDTELDISMHMIIQIIMWSSSICRMK